jgi:glucosylceramidase
MKIHRRNFLLASSAALLAHNKLSFGSNKPVSTASASTPAQAQKQISVYTTANNTNLRISPTETLSFKAFGQPKETQICVFVDPKRQFQTFLGIGGALTDASAEVFAKLPQDKQNELLTAYFDDKKGIGYRLARTNIHSCDFSSGQLHLRQ